MILLAALMLAQTVYGAPDFKLEDLQPFSYAPYLPGKTVSPYSPPIFPLCRVMATPVTMEVVRARLATRNVPAGLWTIHLTCPAGTELTREAIIMAIATECRTRRLPIPLFLPKEAVAPTLFRNRGGKLQLAKRIAMYAGSGAAISAGVPWLSSLGPIADIMTRAADARIPDLSDISMEIPAVVKIPESGAVTLGAWSSKISNPQPIGPFDLGATVKDSLTVRPGNVVSIPASRPIAWQDGGLVKEIKRDPDGKIARSESAKNAFKRANPCPANGNRRGACPGYVIDHVYPLACGGLDDPSNMQWQDRKAAKIKDGWELGMPGCPTKIRTPSRIARWMRATVGKDR